MGNDTQITGTLEAQLYYLEDLERSLSHPEFISPRDYGGMDKSALLKKLNDAWQDTIAIVSDMKESPIKIATDRIDLTSRYKDENYIIDNPVAETAESFINRRENKNLISYNIYQGVMSLFPEEFTKVPINQNKIYKHINVHMDDLDDQLRDMLGDELNRYASMSEKQQNETHEKTDRVLRDLFLRSMKSDKTASVGIINQGIRLFNYVSDTLGNVIDYVAPDVEINPSEVFDFLHKHITEDFYEESNLIPKLTEQYKNLTNELSSAFTKRVHTIVNDEMSDVKNKLGKDIDFQDVQKIFFKNRYLQYSTMQKVKSFIGQIRNPVKPKEAVETPGSVKEVYECITDMAKSDGSKIDRLYVVLEAMQTKSKEASKGSPNKDRAFKKSIDRTISDIKKEYRVNRSNFKGAKSRLGKILKKQLDKTSEESVIASTSFSAR